MKTTARATAQLALAAALALALGGCGESGGPGEPGESGRAEAPPAGAPLDLPPFDPERVPERLALLVGIDRYAPGSELPELDGAVNDVRAVREMLVAHFGFAREDVLLLENEQATHERIVRTFAAWLLGRAGRTTEVVFWFSGHGSRVPDAPDSNGEETDGLDETLLAYDSRANGRSGGYDLVDDELSALLAALDRRTKRATIVTDCCHSGSVARGNPERRAKVRFAAAGSEPFDAASIASFWPADLPLERDEKFGQAPVSYVHIAACGPAQLAHEMRDTAHGALTYFLLRALENAQPELSYRQLADEAAVRVSSSFPGQTVWYEGGLERAVFSGQFPPRPPGLAASLQSSDRLKLNTGPWSGLRVGSKLGVYDALSFERVGSAVVGAISISGARASFVADGEAELREGGALRAVEESRPAGLEPLPVFVEDGELAARLEGSEACRVLREPGPERYLVALEEGRFALRTPDGLRIWLESADSAGAEQRASHAARALVVRFGDELRYRALHLLAQVPNEIPIEASFEQPTEADRASEGEKPWVDAQLRRHGAGRAANGEFEAVGNRPDSASEYRVVILRVRNPGDEPLYVTVISIAEDRSRNRIWPSRYKGKDAALVPAGEELRVPVAVAFDPRWSEYVPGRAMRDRYLVLATREYPGISFQDQSSQLRGGEPEPSSRWSAVAELALAGERTRGSAKPVPLDPRELGIRVVDLLVRGED